GEIVHVGSGDGGQDQITDRHIRRNAATIRLRTRRGFVLEGAEGHKLSVGPEQWMELKDVKVGQHIPLAVGDNIWPEHMVPVVQPARKVVARVEDVAVAAGVSVHTVYCSLGDKTAYAKDRVDAAMQSTGYSFGNTGKPLYASRFPLVSPD